jgi:murein L,D-transpeptidase YcbB/YkuD
MTDRDRSRTERLELDALYRARGDAPLWLEPSARLTADAREALGLLTGAGAEGLDPADYRAADLEQVAALIGSGAAPEPLDLAAFDVGLSLGTLRYLRHLHTGRVNPKALGFRIATRADEHDFAGIVRDAVAAHRVRAAAEELTPPLALYRNLRERLATYRSLAADTALVPPVPSRASVHPNESYAGLADLHRLLVAVGDLPADAQVPTDTRYEGAMVDGAKRFQLRHGLATDGVLGQGTQAALRVPLAARVRQIELSLERLRWLPHIGDGPLVAVNIPMFRMWTWDSVPDSVMPRSTMGVIVGRALTTETPIFIQEMRSVVLRPYWNVPASIAREEILPAIRRDPTYLERQDMEIVSGQSDIAASVPLSPESLARVERGELRVRQRPGPRNALGLVKFVFPNDENVYMHDTPAHELFSRSRRDFSHGCIRVEDPVALAEWVLGNEPDWTRERILSAMQGKESRTVTLSRPVQVVLFYVTAVVMPDDGSVRFAEDIYRHDAALERALSRR